MENQVVIKKEGNGCRTGCILGLASLGLLGLVSAGCVIIVILLGKVLIEDYTAIQEKVVQPICINRKTLTNEMYLSTFTQEYRSKYSLIVAKESLNDIFNENFDCDSINTHNFTELFTKGISIHITKSTSGNTAEISFNTDSGKRSIRILLKAEDGSWKVDEILEAAGQ